MKNLFGFSVLTSGLLLGLSLATSAMATDATSCAGCHGTDGVSTDANVPIIAGLSAGYITATMGDYKKKERPCADMAVLAGDKKGSKTDMCKVAADLNAADLDQIAKTFAAKKFVPFKQAADPALAAKGKALHANLCEKCHTEGGSVADDDAGILAGQAAGYIKTQLIDFKSGKRPMPAKMQPKFEPVQPADIDALTQFYASFK
jgi:sulfide dehydrogenase cytochrome subunit